YHRLCYAKAPLKPVAPEDIPGMLNSTLAFLSVPRVELRITGDFEKELEPLLKELDISKFSGDRAIVPCLEQQLPSIHPRFPGAIILKSRQGLCRCAGVNTHSRFTTESEIQVSFGALFGLSDNLCSGNDYSLYNLSDKILEQFLPSDLWVFREVAAVSGSQENFNDARHLSCILRDSLESRAQANNESLIIAAALAQTPNGDSRSYVEILYSLGTVAKKKEWFRRYVTVLFELVLPPLVQCGIGLEAHGQNLVARNHVGLLLGALGLESHGGWAIALKVLSATLRSEEGSPGRSLLNYFCKDTMPLKCFLRMRMRASTGM
ncbi:IucC family-domain-containing protein, partial [Penicillium odoratum]|uniref:IucC family-domain-containing protein n=1 Tax=Penicillium odoratum TaxID=1167516 RepID=UPI002549AD73